MLYIFFQLRPEFTDVVSEMEQLSHMITPKGMEAIRYRFAFSASRFCLLYGQCTPECNLKDSGKIAHKLE